TRWLLVRARRRGALGRVLLSVDAGDPLARPPAPGATDLVRGAAQARDQAAGAPAGHAAGAAVLGLAVGAHNGAHLRRCGCSEPDRGPHGIERRRYPGELLETDRALADQHL